MTLTIIWLTAHDNMDNLSTCIKISGSSDVACIWALKPEQLLKKMTAVSFAITVLLKPAFIQTGTKAARHSDSLGVWGNVSALITHLFWEREGGELKWNLRRSPQLPGLSDCCGCKFLVKWLAVSFLSSFFHKFSFTYGWYSRAGPLTSRL